MYIMSYQPRPTGNVIPAEAYRDNFATPPLLPRERRRPAALRRAPYTTLYYAILYDTIRYYTIVNFAPLRAGAPVVHAVEVVQAAHGGVRQVEVHLARGPRSRAIIIIIIIIIMIIVILTIIMIILIIIRKIIMMMIIIIVIIIIISISIIILPVHSNCDHNNNNAQYY